MAENSKISWTDHTWNGWWGCTQVSPACDRCYAMAFAGGFPNFYDGKPHTTKKGEVKDPLPIIWGPDAERRFFGDKHWAEPLKWNRSALEAFGRPARVFCMSMADVFEDREDLEPHRERLWSLIGQTPNLRWNLLTKRHLAIAKYKPKWSLLPNVHPGVTVENQIYDHRITSDVEWISAEPLLGPLRLENLPATHIQNLRWVIIGGESGVGAREMRPEWAFNLIQECRELGVAVHFKQTGEALARRLELHDRSGKDLKEWPPEFRVQEFPDELKPEGLFAGAGTVGK